MFHKENFYLVFYHCIRNKILNKTSLQNSISPRKTRDFWAEEFAFLLSYWHCLCLRKEPFSPLLFRLFPCVVNSQIPLYDATVRIYVYTMPSRNQERTEPYETKRITVCSAGMASYRSRSEAGTRAGGEYVGYWSRG